MEVTFIDSLFHVRKTNIKCSLRIHTDTYAHVSRTKNQYQMFVEDTYAQLFSLMSPVTKSIITGVASQVACELVFTVA
jgi:hypothetical protein